MQMLKYGPVHRKYVGDTRMRTASQHNAAQIKRTVEADIQIRKRGIPSPVTDEYPCCSTFARLFKEAKTRCGAKSHLCGDLSRLDTHLKSMDQGKKSLNNCKICGNPEYSKRVACGVHLHAMIN